MVLSVVAAARSGTGDPAIESIVVTAETGAPETVVIRLNSSHTPKTFRMDGQRPRLVFDFYNVRYLFEKLKIAGAGGSIVAGVRAGRHRNPLKTRVVIDIVPGTVYQYDYTFNVSNNSLEIIFNPAELKAPSPDVQRHLKAESLKIVRTENNDPAAAPIEDKQEPGEEKVDPAEKKAVRDRSEPAVSAPEIAVLSADLKKQKRALTAEEGTTEAPQVKADETPGVAASPVDSEPETGQIAEPETGQIAEADQQPPVILDISFEESINNSETVLFKLSHFSPPLVFGIEKGTPRVVCDFLDGEVKPTVPAIIEAGGKYVNRITVNNLTDPKKVRVEMELAVDHHYDLQQLFFKEDNLFVVIVNELAE